MARLPIGGRISERRKEKGLTQSALAGLVGISASYLNLIEHDKRAIGGALLKRIATTLEVDLDRLSGTDDARLAQDITEIARSLSMRNVEEEGAARFVAYSPEWAEAFIGLYRVYQDANQTALALSERLNQDPTLRELSHAVLTQITSIRSFAEILEQVPDLGPDDRLRFSSIIASQSDQLGSSARDMIALLDTGTDTPKPASPASEVDDFIMAHRYYFPVLEAAAEDLRARLDREADTLSGAIVQRLTHRHGIEILVHGKGRTETFLRTAVEPVPEPALVIDEWAMGTTARFQQARRLVEIELADLLDGLAADRRLNSKESRRLGGQALANYATAALLFPYDALLDAAGQYRYDIERLGARFGGSFEQIAQRLVSLRKPGAEGIPFSFLRADPAGNLSKTLSIPGLRMPRWGGACPLWAIYAAFGSPERTVAQLAAMPHGERYLFIARRRTRSRESFTRPSTTFSIMLGCDASYADRIVYGDAFTAGRETLETPVGFNCRSCPRPDCAQRAQASIVTPENQRLVSTTGT